MRDIILQIGEEDQVEENLAKLAPPVRAKIESAVAGGLGKPIEVIPEEESETGHVHAKFNGGVKLTYMPGTGTLAGVEPGSKGKLVSKSSSE